MERRRFTLILDLNEAQSYSAGTPRIKMFHMQPVIQNVADPQRNGRIGKVFELAEPCFRRGMERDFRI